MTKIIASGLSNKSFSLFKFYAARCKRIIPALLLMSAILSIATLFWLPTNEYRKLGNYTGYVALFLSNIKLNKESGNYFTTDSHENWFLHTWSLSVEWQFYLILPLILIALYPLRKKIDTGISLLIITLFSFLACVFYSPTNPSSAFYLMPYRAWEMLCGGLVWYATKRYVFPLRLRPVAAIVGYIIIFLSVFLIKSDAAWPGLLTLFPVAGTMLVIYSNYQPLVAVFDRNFRWVGLSSYSTYLWHWPIAVFLIYAGQQHNALWITGAIALSFLAGWISWVIVEQPAKTFLNQLSQPKFWSTIVCCIGFAYLFSHLVKTEVIMSHPNALVNKIATEANNKNHAANVKTHMSYYGEGDPVAIIIGDSHAEATATALAEAVKDKGSVVGITYSGCPNLANGELAGHDGCRKFNQSLRTRLDGYPANIPVIIVNRLTHYAENKMVVFGNKKMSNATYREQYANAVKDMACSLSQTHPVFLVRPIPEMDVNVPRYLSHALMTGRKPQDIFISLASYNKRNRYIIQAQDQAAEQCGVKELDPTPYLCANGRCMGSKNLQPWYFDDNHLSETGNKTLVPMFRKVFDAQPANSYE